MNATELCLQCGQVQPTRVERTIDGYFTICAMCGKTLEFVQDDPNELPEDDGDYEFDDDDWELAL